MCILKQLCFQYVGVFGFVLHSLVRPQSIKNMSMVEGTKLGRIRGVESKQSFYGMNETECSSELARSLQELCLFCVMDNFLQEE